MSSNPSLLVDMTASLCFPSMFTVRLLGVSPLDESYRHSRLMLFADLAERGVGDAISASRGMETR